MVDLLKFFSFPVLARIFPGYIHLLTCLHYIRLSAGVSVSGRRHLRFYLRKVEFCVFGCWILLHSSGRYYFLFIYMFCLMYVDFSVYISFICRSFVVVV